jgi:hypothetical protein
MVAFEWHGAEVGSRFVFGEAQVQEPPPPMKVQ